MGSKSDMPVMENCIKTLEEFGVPYEVKILSAHRTIDEVLAFCERAEEEYDVIIAAAGYAAHLGGVIAAKTVLPVIGVPLDASPLKGVDSLLSIVQMPGGIPVATVTIGKAGAKNAAVLAVEIMAIKYPELREKLKAYREEMKRKVLEG
ncbi:MAG: 5-(carboxyamino)imidazole ribonucleotide mutase [Desulfurobacteriaceae bacterium]